MVLDSHAKSTCTMSHCLAYTSHTEDSESLVLGVVAKAETFAAPFGFADGGKGDGYAAESAKDEEKGDYGKFSNAH